MIDHRELAARLAQVPQWRQEQWLHAVKELLSHGRVVLLVEVIELADGLGKHRYRAQAINSQGETRAPREWSNGRLESLSWFCREAQRGALLVVDNPLIRAGAAGGILEEGNRDVN